MKLLILVMMSLALTVSCSRNKSASSDSPEIELADVDEFSESEFDSGLSEKSLEGEVEALAEEVVDNTPSLELNPADEKSYTVSKNETLMMVSFKVYGDYSKWRDIANLNQGVLNGSTKLKEGMVLRYQAPLQEFAWDPQGNPYLIQFGDTLGTISGSVYGTPKKWKSIWDNNRPLIKDPNKIYAGFTLYYLSQEQVAQSL